ncbi:MAG TPA: sialidase family protein [Candidatus Limnocylindrales bacterium]|nr:sialidase family protein [Candidatus Limnocylindrales bacterium]
MKRSMFPAVAAALMLMVGVAAAPASAQTGADTRVSIGSPSGPFSANKQNEPAVAVDQAHPTVLAAGANDNIDMESCNAGPDGTCPFTDGIGGSGIYFSFDSGATWTQPTYTGLSARNCTGTLGDGDPGCVPQVGPIGTLPNYYENGLVSDGDPALAFGPAPGPGGFSYANGSRLYYANLTSALAGHSPFKGFEAIAVSHTDDVRAAAAGDAGAWSAPVIASKQNSALFSDKEQLWADNAASSSFFGNVYVCYAGFRSGPSVSQPLFVLTSRDGGESWDQKQVTPATNNTSSKNGFGRSGCTIRTDSTGVVYVFDYQFAFDPAGSAAGKIQMITSTDGGATWSRPRDLMTVLDGCAYVEASIGRCVMDGVGGARDDLMPDPSVDIANGAPTGADATDQIVLSTTEQVALNDENVLFTTSTDGGRTWTAPIDVTRAGDRGYYSAPAISPNGTEAWIVYNAFLEPFKTSAEGPANDRPMDAVILHADIASNGAVGAFTEIHRGASGDARGSSQNNLAAEFLGDYVYAAATRTYGTAVWNDVRNAADCPAIDEYRQGLHDEALATGAATADAEEPRGEMLREARGKKTQEDGGPPAVQQSCPTSFGNSDIYGGSFPNP